jgi:hypothetical protein
VEVGVVASAEDRDRIDRKRYADQTAAYRKRRRCRVQVEPAAFASEATSDAGPLDGEIGELERIEDADPELVEVLAAYLDRNPRRGEEMPGWLAIAMWADGYPPSPPRGPSRSRWLPRSYGRWPREA